MQHCSFKEMQYIAYSNDGGLTFKQYTKNPVIDLGKKDFRDPNVFWHAPTKQWIMTVAMVDEHMVRIYGSKNLKEWKKLSDFGPAGFIKNGWECPSLLPVTVDDNPAKTKWVLLVSAGGEHGPLMQSYVGDFDGNTFKNDNTADKVLKVDYGDAFYAAIAWRDAPANKKILLGWLQNGRPETSPWKGQMSIPRELSLKTTPDGLMLMQKPSSIVTHKLLGKPDLFKSSMVINNKTLPLSAMGRFDGNTFWINAAFSGSGYNKAGFNIAVNNGTDKKVIVGYNAVKQELFIDCTGAEKDNKSTEHLIQTAPMKSVNGMVKIQVLMDKSSLEVIGNDGEKVISTMIYPDTDATGLSVFTDGKVLVKSLKIWDLNKK